MPSLKTVCITVCLGLAFGPSGTWKANAQPLTAIEDRLGVPGPLHFDSTDFHLAWSAKPNSRYFKQEYVPSGQSVEHYASMLLVEVVTGSRDVSKTVSIKLDWLKARRSNDPVTNFSILRKEGGDEIILDFTISGRDQSGGAIVEWNAYRYTPYISPTGQPGVILFAISKRAYGDDQGMAFLKVLKKERTRLLGQLAQNKMPAVTLR